MGHACALPRHGDALQVVLLCGEARHRQKPHPQYPARALARARRASPPIPVLSLPRQQRPVAQRRQLGAGVERIGPGLNISAV